MLTDFNATYNEDFAGFSLTTFEDEAVTLDTNPAGRDGVRTWKLCTEVHARLVGGGPRQRLVACAPPTPCTGLKGR